ncbi:hypothetical protein DUNSADRAFT_16709 [Dunaliella salina]|uniref:Encoded protein n=1 Tax=Dunaliella salina TaxID=3046 RepID=A0ABQ7G330_DUNSA|nr:hypothetical protein DUNSADRAFT_16709 [Dunaliella salina]|eukprot:KAF5829005.1 hypothetical protein DUNSADRAFT_16709 [Dunaliella salina]
MTSPGRFGEPSPQGGGAGNWELKVPMPLSSTARALLVWRALVECPRARRKLT